MIRPLLAALLCASAASAAAITRDELKAALDANPDLVVDALGKADRVKFFETVVAAQQDYQRKKQQDQEEQEEKELEAAFKNPLKPALGGKVLMRGSSKAQITIIEYSDFQCPYCKRGFSNMEALREKYGDKVRIGFKNLPLPFHPLAMPAARTLQAIALKSQEKAWAFHDTIFKNQDKLSLDYIQEVVKGLGLDAEKIAKDADSAGVKEQVEADINEAKKFKIEGTPGYIINGVPLRGAYPVEAFDKIIERHLKG